MTAMPQPEAQTHKTPPAPAHAPFILVVDDEPDIRDLLREILEDEGYEVATAENGAAAREAHRRRRPDLVLLDIWMPDIDGITLLKEWSVEGRPPMPVIMMSGHGTVETAVEATRLGAYDFIEKPLSLAKLLLTIEHAIEADKLQKENQGLRSVSDQLDEPIGHSGVIQRLKTQIRRIAEHDTPVLILGEPGSGLRAVARYLHASSPRATRPYRELSVGTLLAGHAAQTLFGSEAGEKIEYGLLEEAAGGTLFIYDIADLDAELQLKLESALAGGEFYRMGGHQAVPLATRIVAGTAADLEALVEQGGFRRELYYHLNILPLRVPPLREHREDVPELLNFYTNLYVNQDNLPYRHFTVAAQNKLRNYSWPGNIRELSNLVQRLLITGSGNEIELDEVNANIESMRADQAGTLSGRSGFDLPLREAREQFEKAYFEYQLEKTGGSVGKVAELAAMERTHLYRKLKALGIEPKKFARGK